MSTTNQTTLVDAWRTLGPTTRIALQLCAGIGGISVLYYLGYLSFKGLGILTMILLSVSLIVMSLSGAELATREAVAAKVQALWDLMKSGFTQAMAAGQQQQQQATAS